MQNYNKKQIISIMLMRIFMEHAMISMSRNIDCLPAQTADMGDKSRAHPHHYTACSHFVMVVIGLYQSIFFNPQGYITAT